LVKWKETKGLTKLVNDMLDGYRQDCMSYEEIFLRRRQKDEGQDE